MEQPIPTVRHRYTVEEYLRLDEASDRRHEYRDGDVIAMAGTTFRHGRIVRNLIVRLTDRLAGSTCEVFFLDIRVRVDRGRYTYSDLGIVCDGPTFDPPERDVTLTNPRVLIEVQSASTGPADRADKLYRYIAVPSLQEYIIVYQDRPRAETFYRQPDGVWAIGGYAEGLDAVLVVRSLGVEVPLAQVYAGVTFPPLPAPPELLAD